MINMPYTQEVASILQKGIAQRDAKDSGIQQTDIASALKGYKDNPVGMFGASSGAVGNKNFFDNQILNNIANGMSVKDSISKYVSGSYDDMSKQYDQMIGAIGNLWG